VIRVEWFYWLIALVFAITAGVRLTDRRDPKRLPSAAFWGILAAAFVLGTFVAPKRGSGFPTMPHGALIEGVLVLGLVVLAGFGFPGRGDDSRVSTQDQRAKSADRLGNKLFLPALLIPLIAVVFGSALATVKLGRTPLLESGFATIIGLGVASIVALIVAMVIFRVQDIVTPFRESDRLLGHIGWAAILPQFLATLGLLFTQAGIGQAVGKIVQAVLPHGQLLVAVILYCIGMFIFTFIMGNAFAAFPVMTAAIGWPILVQQFGGNPAPVFAIGMLAGFCGTLCTPMAANFNLVPAALLELDDQYGPIKAQVMTALPLWACNVFFMYFLCFPR
jgi:uncharacterized membrane protein